LEDPSDLQQSPKSRTAVRETLWTSKEFLFLLLGSYAVTALLDKGEKEELYLRTIEPS